VWGGVGVEAALGSSDVKAALDSDGGEVALRSSSMGRHQAHGGTSVEMALGSSGVEVVHQMEVDFGVEAVLDSDSDEVASRQARI
jgi:hypothetical protein